MASTAERNTVPFPTGPPVSLSARTIRGLYCGSFRWSATKSNTAPAGRAMTISPSMKVMSHLSADVAGFGHAVQAERAAGVGAAHVQPERRIGVGHQRGVRGDPQHPPVHPEHEVEHRLRVPA